MLRSPSLTSLPDGWFPFLADRAHSLAEDAPAHLHGAFIPPGPGRAALPSPFILQGEAPESTDVDLAAQQSAQGRETRQ